MSNIIAIVGRPNVGKSTLFNRLVEKRKAIIHDESGVTRDRHYGLSDWNGKIFTVIDTGGYVENSNNIFEKKIKEQVILALSEASVILFMVDCKDGITSLDYDFSKIIRELNKDTILVANKADDDKLSQVNLPRISILGRPNVGKSSFTNAILGEERNIVTEISGTTRDSIDTEYNMFNKNFIITDTAGIRKKSKVKENIEFYSVMRSIQALENSDVAIIMIDAKQGFEGQDMNILSLAVKYKKGIIIMVNKWDLIKKDNSSLREYEKSIQNKISPFSYIPIIFSSVLKKQRILQTLEKSLEIFENRKQKISTSQLNNKILPEIQKYPPPSTKGKYIKIKYITQLPTNTPTFAFFCNLPQYIKEPY